MLNSERTTVAPLPDAAQADILFEAAEHDELRPPRDQAVKDGLLRRFRSWRMENSVTEL
jgi:hypothetical protein